MKNNEKVIILYNSTYNSEAHEIGKKILNAKDVKLTYKVINFDFIPYCEKNTLFYDEFEKGRFDEIIILFPVCEYDSGDIYRNFSSIESCDSLVLLISLPDKRFKGTSIYPRLVQIYNKANSISAANLLEKAKRYCDLIRKFASYTFKDIYGSNLSFSRESDILVDVFDDNLNGTFQLPGGEVFFAIEKHSANGILYIDKKEYFVEKNILHSKNQNNEYDGIIICEFGLGINEGVPRSPSLDIAEKAFRTCHFGFGSNRTFDGTIDANYHFDVIFKTFDLYADDELIIRIN